MKMGPLVDLPQLTSLALQDCYRMDQASEAVLGAIRGMQLTSLRLGRCEMHHGDDLHELCRSLPFTHVDLYKCYELSQDELRSLRGAPVAAAHRSRRRVRCLID